MSKKLYLNLFCRNEYGKFVDLELHRARRAAINCETSISQLRELAQHHHFSVRLAVAHNPNVPLEILEQLVCDRHLEVSHQALKHPHTTLDLLNGNSEFNKAKNWRLRVMIARNLQTSLDVLLQLAEDDSAFVRYAVSRNPKTPHDIAVQACNPDYFQQLLQAGATGNNQRQLERLSASHSVKLRMAVANNPNTPRRVMEVLLVDCCYQVRRELARNQKAPESILKVLADDLWSCVRVSVAANPKTSREIKIKLCQDTHPRVQRVAFRCTYRCS